MFGPSPTYRRWNPGTLRTVLRRAGQVVCLALSVFGAALGAGPVLKIDSIAAERFPELEVRAALHFPYPETMEERESRFAVRERSPDDPPDLFAEATLQSIQELPAPETKLYLILVLDTTRSVPRKAFRGSVDAAVTLVNSLADGESAAVYRINARPLLASGFTTDRKALVRTLQSFQRTGRITRLYDSLHSAVLTAHRTQKLAAERASAGDGPTERTAIVLLTDGRDEGSFLTDNDCAELAALSRSYNVPIYTVLYGNSKNLPALTRLSARTGGMLIRGLQMQRIAAIPAELRRPRARHYRLRYRSQFDPGGLWPVGQPVQVDLDWNGTGSSDGAAARYRVPFPGGLSLLLRRPNALVYAAAAGLLLLGLLVALLVLWLLLRGRRTRMERATPTVAFESEAEEDAGDGQVVFEDASVPPVVEADEDFFVDTETDAVGPLVAAETVDHTDDSFFDDEHRENPMAAGLLRERRRIMNPVRETQSELYMRDYSYRMLQNALRQATRYSEASLARATAHGDSEYDVFLETTILGTGRWANIHLDDPSASPIHAKIRQVDHKFVIYDMLSAAGVFLNGRKILRPMPLGDGDEIRLGRSVLTFRGTV